MSTENDSAIVKTAFTAAVRARVALGSHTRWGGSDSVAVIEAVCDASAGDFSLARPFVEQVVNPSAFAQVLEKLPSSGFDEHGDKIDGGKFPHPSYIARPEKGTRKASVSDSL